MKRSISPDTKRELDAAFLPELHRARWAETLAQLEKAKQAAATPADVEVVKAQIREHMKHEYDTAQTRRELEAEYARNLQAKRPRSRSR